MLDSLARAAKNKGDEHRQPRQPEVSADGPCAESAVVPPDHEGEDGKLQDMRDFPDMAVTFDKLENTPNGMEFHWTFTGRNTGPGGTGNKVRISGYELWKIDDTGLIAESSGHFDVAEYERQLKGASL